MLTALVYAVCAALLWRCWQRKPQAITATLAATFAMAVALSLVRHGADLRPLLVALDAWVVAAMAVLWSMYRSQRARVVGAIGMANLGFALLAGGLESAWGPWAAADNADFVVQVLVAGGDCDGIGAWLADRGRRLRARFPRLSGNVGG